MIFRGARIGIKESLDLKKAELLYANILNNLGIKYKAGNNF